MKKLILALLIVCLVSISCFSKEFTMNGSFVYPTDVEDEVAGFNLYREGMVVYTITDPSIRAFPVVLDIDGSSADYYLTAFDFAGQESEPSNIEVLDPPPWGTPTLFNLEIVAP